MRPRGEIRQVLGEAAQALAEERGGATWRDMAVRACVGFSKARETVKDMARAGELEPCGTERVAHARRPMVRYAPRTSFATATTGSIDIVMRSWR